MTTSSKKVSKGATYSVVDVPGLVESPRLSLARSWSTSAAGDGQKRPQCPSLAEEGRPALRASDGPACSVLSVCKNIISASVTFPDACITKDVTTALGAQLR